MASPAEVGDVAETWGRRHRAGPTAFAALPSRRRPRFRRASIAVLAIGAALAGAAGWSGTVAGASAQAQPGADGTHAPLIAPLTLLARLQTKHPARQTPDPAGLLVAVVNPNRPLTAEQTVLPVLSQTVGSDGQMWLEVRLPGRPLHGQVLAQIGWIKAAGTVFRHTSWHIVVNTERRRASVFRHGVEIRRFRVIVGKPSTPTPLGSYFVEENVALGSADVGAPYALATSARSAVLQEFLGGPGQIALHGRGNIGGKLGTAVSHGCIRFGTHAITWLAKRIPPGTPVTIV